MLSVLFPFVFGSIFWAGGCHSSDENKSASNGSSFGGNASASSRPHNLPALEILAEDIRIMQREYVDSHRFKDKLIDEMFMGVLTELEQEFDEIRLVRNKQTLYVTVGVKQKEFSVPEFSSLDIFYNAMRPVVSFLDEELSLKVDRAAVEYAIINGAFSALDPHTTLLPPVQAAEMDVDNSGEFGGLGIEIFIKEGALTIKRPIEDTPASKAGLQADDKIVQIEEFSTVNMDVMEAVSILRGAVGEPVTIHIMRKGLDKPMPVTIIRGLIKIDPVKGELLKNRILWIRLQSFNANVSDDMNEIIDRHMKKTDLNGIILDLRYNPGGYLSQARYIADRFIDKGNILSTVEGSARKKEFYRATKADSITDIPVAVLINSNSASASEIVAGAIRNLDRGIIIGEKSFGKGSVQQLHRNRDGSKLKMTIAQYLTPGEKSIQSVGIAPDIQLRSSLLEDEEGEEFIALYWDEWADREADLQHHLSYDKTLKDETAFSVRYLQPADTNMNKIEPSKDWEVQFARRALLAAPVANRREALAQLGGFIKREQALQQKDIAQAFERFNRDWRIGENPTGDALNVDIEMVGTDNFISGQAKDITFKIKNTSDQPLHQISVWTESDSAVFNRKEFYVGFLDVGGAYTQTKSIRFPYGHSTQNDKFTIVLRDQDNKELKRIPWHYSVKENKRPQFAYSVQFFDDGSEQSKGNGDRVPQKGEVFEVEIKLKNIGKGRAIRPFVSLKNKARKYLNLEKGNLELGTWKKIDGSSCEKDSVDCYNIIEPGEEFSERLRFSIIRDLSKAEGEPHFFLQIGDNFAYDYNTIRAGFSSYFRLEKKLNIVSEQKCESVSGQQPAITITRPPEPKKGGEILFSGKVEDDSGVQQLMIFQNDKKIYYQGEDSGVTELPFGVETRLKKGSNRFSLLAKDTDGLGITHTIFLYKEQGE